MADVAGHPMLWHVIYRIRQARLVDQVVVATTTLPADDAVAAFAKAHNITVFRGSEDDTLDRYYQAAKAIGADTVVRISGDCPLVDPTVIDLVIQVFQGGNYDYVSNTLHYTYPDGLDVEAFSFSSLEKAWREARLPAEREHVTSYIRASGRFRIANVRNEEHLSARNLRWTVDDPADLEFVREVYRYLGKENSNFGMNEVLRLLDDHPELLEINRGIVRNEGYYKSLVREPPVPPRHYSIAKSLEFKGRAQKVIPSCTQTFSKGPTQFVQGVAPVFLERGQGSHVWDVDGNEYIDYAMALGPIILGHNYPSVTEAVMRQMKDGTTFSLPHPLEVRLAEMLVEVIPCAEMVRFAKNGSDVTSGAVRVARAYTGRDVIACCGYHGWQDWYIGTTTRNKGVPKPLAELSISCEYNNIASLERAFSEHPGKVAAVIMEPVGVAEPRDGFLRKVRDLTQREGALLIFDEIVTGFRMALGGAQEYYGVTPDLACFGKAMGNGYPIAAVVGRREIMELFDEVFFSFTFGGEALSLAAAVATITEIRERDVIEHLWEQGQKLKDGYNVLAREFKLDERTGCVGFPPRTVVTFKDENGEDSLLLKSLFQQECIRRGVLFSGSQNMCYSHNDADIDHTLRVYRTAMEILADAIHKENVKDRLEGEVVQPVFRRA
jgi:glutamate-1-semialdehyde 2,1-aminomutase/spore coat polysaccharide biosynthesis protein SpsF